MASSEKTTVRRIKDEDIPALMKFFQELDPHNKKLNDRELWRWKYADSPNTSPDYPYFVIEVGDQIKGALAYLPFMISVGGKAMKSGHLADYFVAKEYRGIPAVRLLKECMKDCPVWMTASMSKHTKRLFPKMGFVDLSDHVNSYYLALDCSLFSSREGQKSGRSLVSALYGNVRRLWLALLNIYYSRQSPDTVTYQVTDSFDRAMVPNGPELRERTAIVKDADYIEWRYAKSPVLNCIYIGQTNRETRDGLAVLQIDASAKEAVLLDFIHRSPTSPAAVCLILQVIKYCRSRGCTLLSTQMLNHPLEDILKRLRFGYGASSLGFMAYSEVTSIQDKLGDVKHWSFMIGDTDVY